MGMQKTINIDVSSFTPLWPYKVVQVIEQVMQEGEAKHPDEQWLNEDIIHHIHCANNHLSAWKQIRVGTAPDDGEDHLAHAFTRLMMAVAIKNVYMKEDADA